LTSHISIAGLDHIVLLCPDVERTLGWYVDLLRLEPVRLEDWRSGTAPFPSVRVDSGTIIDFMEGDADGGRLDHVCFEIEPTDLTELAAADEFDVVEGPSPRFGARGMGTSLYVRDPDGTVVELRHY
jgi:catechol 2,3-dioxygenase-like lactoylglutathione lyase family enzyme